MKIKSIIIATALSAVTSTTIMASENDHRHFPGIFLGASTIDGETDFSYGLEYEYKPTKLIGAGIVYENTDNAEHSDGVEVLLAAVYLHPWKELRLGVGFGREKVGGDHSHKESLARISINYDFHVGGIGIAPTVAVDFVGGETDTIVGLSFIKSF